MPGCTNSLQKGGAKEKSFMKTVIKFKYYNLKWKEAERINSHQFPSKWIFENSREQFSNDSGTKNETWERDIETSSLSFGYF